ncbi:MAG: hypothetical protein C4551_04220 [Bacillota bacterium]|nr:MAG: hypothetical protein C4551_04220 [Bacillota bacterium]
MPMTRTTTYRATNSERPKSRPRGRGGPIRGASRRRGWPAAIFGLLVLAGLLRRETLDILFNATLLCLSCMGLGK